MEFCVLAKMLLEELMTWFQPWPGSSIIFYHGFEFVAGTVQGGTRIGSAPCHAAWELCAVILKKWDD